MLALALYLALSHKEEVRTPSPPEPRLSNDKYKFLRTHYNGGVIYLAADKSRKALFTDGQIECVKSELRAGKTPDIPSGYDAELLTSYAQAELDAEPVSRADLRKYGLIKATIADKDALAESVDTLYKSLSDDEGQSRRIDEVL